MFRRAHRHVCVRFQSTTSTVAEQVLLARAAELGYPIWINDNDANKPSAELVSFRQAGLHGCLMVDASPSNLMVKMDLTSVPTMKDEATFLEILDAFHHEREAYKRRSWHSFGWSVLIGAAFGIATDEWLLIPMSMMFVTITVGIPLELLWLAKFWFHVKTPNKACRRRVRRRLRRDLKIEC